MDYDLVTATKIPLYKKASENFKGQASPENLEEFEYFCYNHSYWLNDYALFMSLKEAHDGAKWNTWDKAIAYRERDAIDEWTEKLSETIFYHKFVQFQFFRQWQDLKKYANEQGITIIGDIPIYVAHDSADVWSHPDIFCLDQKTGEPSTMAGVPPDYFSATGQLWGNPVYLWKQLEKKDFKWWIERIKGMLEYVDVMRIDHFRGFEAFWGVKPGEKTAMKGKWIKAPGEIFFKLLYEKLGKLPIVAEDLGVITEEVEALRDKFEFPGMKVIHFAFDSDRKNPFLPYNFTRNCIVYTGTHDNNTTVGWYEERSPEEKNRVLDYLGCVDPKGIHWSMIRLALSSIANVAIFPMQDLLGLGTEGKMNTPGKAEGNWSWRYLPDGVTTEIGDHLRHLTWVYGRSPYS